MQEFYGSGIGHLSAFYECKRVINTRDTGLAGGENCMVLRSFISTYWCVTDRQTDTPSSANMR